MGISHGKSGAGGGGGSFFFMEKPAVTQLNQCWKNFSRVLQEQFSSNAD